MTNKNFSKVIARHAFSTKTLLGLVMLMYLAMITLPASILNRRSLSAQTQSNIPQTEQTIEPSDVASVSEGQPVSDDSGTNVILENGQQPRGETESVSNSNVSISSSMSSSSSEGSHSSTTITTESSDGEIKETVIESDKSPGSTVRLNLSTDPDSKLKVRDRNGSLKIDYRSSSETNN